MEVNVFSNELLIGTATLKPGDISMGHIYGEFLPNENYYKYIQQETWHFVATNNKDHHRWNNLRLNIQFKNGLSITNVGGIEFDDLPELPDEPIRIDIAGTNYESIKEYFVLDK
jgi:hypothetical protein